MADWLVERGIQTVVLQSTGVYWIPVHDILEERGLRVFFVNAYHTRTKANSTRSKTTASFKFACCARKARESGYTITLSPTA